MIAQPNEHTNIEFNTNRFFAKRLVDTIEVTGFRIRLKRALFTWKERVASNNFIRSVNK